MKNILLIGTGRFGRHIAVQLSQLGHQVMAVDTNEERMLCCSITAVSFSSVFYILICGAVGLVVFFLRKIRKGDGKTS